MKANFRGVTTAHTQTGTRSHWKRRDEARKREIARSKDDKRMSSLIMSEMASEIAELRKPKPMIVKLDPDEELMRPNNIDKQRIYSRVLEMCFPVEVKGVDRRKKKLRDDSADMARLLGL